MEHVPFPENCNPSPLVVPHFKLAPGYDYKGFKDFPERCGWDRDWVFSPAFQDEVQSRLPQPELFPSDGSSTEIFKRFCQASFLQEWLWFGLLHELETAWQVPINWEELTAWSDQEGLQLLKTDWLPSFTRSLVNNRIREQNVPLMLEPGDVVFAPQSCFKDSSNLSLLVESCSATARSLGLSKSRADMLGPFIVTENSKNFSVKCRTEGNHLTLSVWFLECNSQKSKSMSLDQVAAITQNLSKEMLYQATSTVHLVRPHTKDSLFERRISSCTNALMIARLYFMETMHLDVPLGLIETALACQLLYDALEEVLLAAFDQEITSSNLDMKNYQIDRAVAQGWCPSRISAVMKTKSTTIQFITSLLPSNDDRTHYDCTAFQCEHENQFGKAVLPQHDPTSCKGDCEYVSYLENDAMRLIHSGGIPGLSRNVKVDGRGRFDICDIRGKSYTALSHVWSHGMGNSSENGLFQCQLDSVFDRLGKIHEMEPVGKNASKLLVWIDTLCVPVELDSKKLAMREMRNIYRNAGKVLVIDRYLLQVGRDWLERCLQLMCSEWQRRLWTFQEGALASNLWIQYKHDAVHIRDMSNIIKSPLYGQRAFHEVLDEITAHHLPDMGLSFVERNGLFQDLRNRFSRDSGSEVNTANVIRDFAHRTTSVEADEPICLATMMDLPLERYNDKPTMERIYSDVRILPRDILFLKYDRLSKPGFSWAPTSLLNRGSVVLDFDVKRTQTIAYVEPEGLMVLVDVLELEVSIDKEQFSEGEHTFLISLADGSQFLLLLAGEMLKDREGSSKFIQNPFVLVDSSWVKPHATADCVIASRVEPASRVDASEWFSRFKTPQAEAGRNAVLHCHFETNEGIIAMYKPNSVNPFANNKDLLNSAKRIRGKLHTSLIVCVD